MSLNISLEWFCFIVPALIAFILQFKFNPTKTGGNFFPPSSERDMYWFFAIPLYLIVSFAAWAIYLKVVE